jgi:transposase
MYCGIDWSERHHDIATVNGDGELVAKRRIAATVDGFDQLVAMLVEAGDDADAPIPVAIETPRRLLVAALRATGRPVYAINPLAAARYRERHAMSGRKSDHADALLLAHCGPGRSAPADLTRPTGAAVCPAHVVAPISPPLPSMNGLRLSSR